MYLAEAIPPVGPLFTPALAALFLIAGCIVAIGMVKLVDAISRSFFGTVGGAIGWIPFAGKVVKHSLHRIEQKISHGLGSAERKLDAVVATSWHNLARLVHYMGREIEGAAVSAYHVALQARAFVRRREVTHEIKGAVTPIKTQAHATNQYVAQEAAQQKALAQSVAQGVYPRVKVIEHDVTHIIVQDIPFGKAQARTAENLAINTYKYLTKHKTSLLTGVFTGAAAWALTRLGGGWIRCKNWRTIGKHVCRWPYSLLEALLGLGLAFAVVIDPRKTAEAAVKAEDVMESLIRKIAD